MYSLLWEGIFSILPRLGKRALRLFSGEEVGCHSIRVMVIAEDLFRAALRLTVPCYISLKKFTEGERKLDICVDFLKVTRFPCPECNHLQCEVRDTTTIT